MATKLSNEIAQDIAVGVDLPKHSTGILLPEGGTVTYLRRNGESITTTLSANTVVRDVARVVKSTARVVAVFLPKGFQPGQIINQPQAGQTVPAVSRLDAISLGLDLARVRWMARPSWYTFVQFSFNGTTWIDAGTAPLGAHEMDIYVAGLLTGNSLYLRARHQSVGAGMVGVYGTANITVGLPNVANFTATTLSSTQITLAWTVNATYKTAIEYRIYSTVTGEIQGWTALSPVNAGVATTIFTPGGNLENGMTYAFRARFTDLTAYSPMYASAVDTASVLTAGSADPTSVSASYAAGGSSLPATVSWTVPTRGHTYAYYTISRQTQGNPATTLLFTSALGSGVHTYDDSFVLSTANTNIYTVRYYWADGTVGLGTVTLPPASSPPA